MAKKTYVRIDGLEKLIRDLNKSGDSIERELVTGVKKASKVVENDMEKRARKLPQATGELSTKTKIVNTYKDEGTVTSLIGPGKNIIHAFFAEVGVYGRRKKTRRQYARPAVDKNKKEIREVITEAVWKAFERVMR